jgi:hypothetical protein
VTLGQLAPSPTGMQNGADFAQLAVGGAGSSYTVPENGTITSWSTNAVSGAGQKLTFKVFRKVSDPAFYSAVGHSGPQDLAGGLLNTFATSIPVQAGDILGLDPTIANAANAGITGDTLLTRTPPLNDGDAAGFTPSTGGRINVSAVFVPSNAITVGATTLNKKKGTATLNLTLPNPGDLTASGSGVSASSAGRAEISKSVTAGPAQLVIKAKGKKKKTLTANGKVKLNVAITYTPTNGAAGTQSVKVKLRKK